MVEYRNQVIQRIQMLMTDTIRSSVLARSVLEEAIRAVEDVPIHQEKEGQDMLLVVSEDSRSEIEKLRKENEQLRAQLNELQQRLDKKDRFVEKLLARYQSMKDRRGTQYCPDCGRELMEGQQCSCRWEY